MINSSDRPKPAKKEGLRCGNVPKDGKFAGEPCKKLLLEIDWKLGLGVRCDRCGKFHPLGELIRGAHRPTQQEGEKMTTGQITRSETAIFQESVANLLKRDILGYRQLGEEIQKVNFDPDRIEDVLKMPLRLGQQNRSHGVRRYTLEWVLEEDSLTRVSEEDLAARLIFKIDNVSRNYGGDLVFMVDLILKMSHLRFSIIKKLEDVEYSSYNRISLFLSGGIRINLGRDKILVDYSNESFPMLDWGLTFSDLKPAE